MIFRKLAVFITLLAGLGIAPQVSHAQWLERQQGARSTAQLPAMLSDEDRAYYRSVFDAIDAQKWTDVQTLLAQKPDGLLTGVAQAEYYLHANSPRVELPQVQEWLSRNVRLPQAEQMARLGVKRGMIEAPYLPPQNTFIWQGGTPHRVRPKTVEDGTMPATVRSAILEKITQDDPAGARLLLDGIDASLSMEARAEWRQRIAWSYYIENQDAAALALALTAREGAGAWVAEADWAAGLAAWRLNDCSTAAQAFQRAAAGAENLELRTAAHYWASRALIRCRRPADAQEQLRKASTYDETLYGMLAAEQLGKPLPERRATSRITENDWRKLSREENVRIALALKEVGRDGLADEVLRHQAQIGDPEEFGEIGRLARALGMPSTQLWLGNNAPRGKRSDPSLRYPVANWEPVNGWKVDPALAFAHTLQESRFQTDALSPAQAKGLMQITPITVRQHAPRLNLDAGYSDLGDPRINLAYGQQNLEMLRDSPGTQGRLPKIMAAYNAGLTPITRWNTEVRDFGDPLLYMESIPYWETRSYVAIVMRNYWMYQRLAGAPSGSKLALAQNAWPQFPRADETNRHTMEAGY